VVLPWVPATAMEYFIRMSSQHLRPGMTGMRLPGGQDFGIILRTAEEVTTTSASFKFFRPMARKISAPSFCSRWVVSTRPGPTRHPVPQVQQTSAIPLMPIPPMPTKCTFRTRCRIPKVWLLISHHLTAEVHDHLCGRGGRGPRPARPSFQSFRIFSQLAHHAAQDLSVHFRVGHQESRAGIDQRPGIERLWSLAA